MVSGVRFRLRFDEFVETAVPRVSVSVAFHVIQQLATLRFGKQWQIGNRSVGIGSDGFEQGLEVSQKALHPLSVEQIGGILQKLDVQAVTDLL